MLLIMSNKYNAQYQDQLPDPEQVDDQEAADSGSPQFKDQTSKYIVIDYNNLPKKVKKE